MSEVITTERKPGFSAAEYNSVAVGAVLHGINLLASSFKVDPDALGEVSDWNLTYGRSVISCHYDENRRYVAAIMQYHVTAKFRRKQAMKCTADYGVFYEVPEGSTKEAALGFCRNVGSFAAYPYFRSLVAQFGWNAGVTLPPLPSIASTAHIPKKNSTDTDGQESGHDPA